MPGYVWLDPAINISNMPCVLHACWLISAFLLTFA